MPKGLIAFLAFLYTSGVFVTSIGFFHMLSDETGSGNWDRFLLVGISLLISTAITNMRARIDYPGRTLV